MPNPQENSHSTIRLQGAYEYGSVATLRCHIGYQRVSRRRLDGMGLKHDRVIAVVGDSFRGLLASHTSSEIP